MSAPLVRSGYSEDWAVEKDEETGRDLDLEAGMMRIERTKMKIKGGSHLNPPKSARGVRVIHLDPLQVLRLKERKRQASSVSVFAYSYSSVKRWWRQAKAALELPDKCRIHDLRHTAATLMLLSGVPLPTVAKVLGDAETTILTTYAHCLPANEAAAIETLVRAIREA